MAGALDTYDEANLLTEWSAHGGGNMLLRKPILAIVALVLLASETYLCSAFLPVRWQVAIQSHLLPQSHDYADVTHPALSEEVDRVLQKHIGVQIALYAFIGLLVAANTYALVRTVKALRERTVP
jgi:hypothetical protein